jgi:hypothetical protein
VTLSDITFDNGAVNCGTTSLSFTEGKGAQPTWLISTAPLDIRITFSSASTFTVNVVYTVTTGTSVNYGT